MAEEEVSGFESPFGDGPLDGTDPQAIEAPPEEAPEVTPEAQALLDAQQREQNANARAEQLQNTLIAQLQTPAPAPQAVAAPPAPMPDPVTDAEGFRTWLAREQAATATAARQEIDVLKGRLKAADETRSADQLFNDYVATRPALRNQRKMVEAAASQAGALLSEPDAEIFRKTDAALAALGVDVGEKQSLPKKKKSDAAAASVGRGSAGPRPAPKPDTSSAEVDFVDQIMDRAHELGLN